MIHGLTPKLLAVGVLAVVLNATAVFYVVPKTTSELSILYGQNRYADGYDELARNLADGNGYRFYTDTAPTMMREPGYPLLLAGVFIVFGQGFAAVKVLNLLMVIGVAWLMLGIGAKVSKNPIVIFLSPFLFLLHPGTIIGESRGGVEILFMLLIALFVFLLYSAIESNGSWRFLVSGGVLGLASLVKSTPLLFPVAVLGYFLLFERRRVSMPAAFKAVGLIVSAMFLTISPWIVRNYIVAKKFVPTASVLGVSAQAGQYICSHLTSESRWFDLDRAAAVERNQRAHELGYKFKDGYYQYFYSSADELKFSNDLLKEVIARYEKTPGLFFRCVGSNMFNFWFAGKTWASTGINLAVQLPLLTLALVGVALSFMNGNLKAVAPLVILILYFMAVCLPILAQARYSVPLIPFLSPIACIPVAAAWKMAKKPLSPQGKTEEDHGRSNGGLSVDRADPGGGSK